MVTYDDDAVMTGSGQYHEKGSSDRHLKLAVLGKPMTPLKTQTHKPHRKDSSPSCDPRSRNKPSFVLVADGFGTQIALTWKFRSSPHMLPDPFRYLLSGSEAQRTRQQRPKKRDIPAQKVPLGYSSSMGHPSPAIMLQSFTIVPRQCWSSPSDIHLTKTKDESARDCSISRAEGPSFQVHKVPVTDLGYKRQKSNVMNSPPQNRQQMPRTGAMDFEPQAKTLMLSETTLGRPYTPTVFLYAKPGPKRRHQTI